MSAHDTLNHDNTDERGFTLVECVCALLITTIGVLSVAALMVTAISTQNVSTDAARANSLARAKIEELRTITLLSPAALRAQRDIGGDLDSDVADHFDVPHPRFIRRWVVASGPAGTLRVTVAIKPNVAGMRLPNVQTETLMR